MQPRNKTISKLLTLSQHANSVPGRCLSFLNAWLWTRRGRLFLQALPSIVVIVVLAAILIIASDARERHLGARYHTRALDAFENDDLETAKLLFRKLSYLRPDLPHGRYGLAMCAQKQRQPSRTLSLMQSVAPDDSHGFGPAHFWMSQWLIGKSQSQTGAPKAATLKLVEHHLVAAIAADVANHTAHAQLGQIQLGRSEYRTAAAHLALAADDRPAVMLTLARTYLRLNKTDMAKQAAEKAMSNYAAQVESNPDNLSLRLALVDAGLISQNYHSCLVALSEGIERFSKRRRPADAASGPNNQSAVLDEDAAVTANKNTGPDHDAQLRILSAALARLYQLWAATLWPQAERLQTLSVDEQVTIQRRKSRAREQAGQSVKHFLNHSKDDPHNVNAWLRLAECEVMLRRFQQATAHLNEGIVYSHDDRLKKRLSAVYVDWANAMSRDPKATPASKLDILLRARRHAPKNEIILTRLASLAGTDTPEAKPAWAALQDVLHSKQAPFSVYFVLGNDALVKKDYESAKLHFEHANKLNSDNPVVLNNLAWLLANTIPHDYARALEAADAAIKKLDNPEIRETRGQILVKMKRWQDALVDLELALKAMPKRPEIHTALATVYQNLNKPDLALKYRQLSGQPAPQMPQTPSN